MHAGRLVRHQAHATRYDLIHPLKEPSALVRQADCRGHIRQIQERRVVLGASGHLQNGMPDPPNDRFGQVTGSPFYVCPLAAYLSLPVGTAQSFVQNAASVVVSWRGAIALPAREGG